MKQILHPKVMKNHKKWKGTPTHNAPTLQWDNWLDGGAPTCAKRGRERLVPLVIRKSVFEPLGARQVCKVHCEYNSWAHETQKINKFQSLKTGICVHLQFIGKNCAVVCTLCKPALSKQEHVFGSNRSLLHKTGTKQFTDNRGRTTFRGP